MTTKTKPPEVTVPVGARQREPLACARCGAVRWDRARELLRVYNHFVRRRRATSAEVSGALGIAISNASDKIGRLVRMRLLRVVEEESHPTGGKLKVYGLVDEAA